MIPIQKNIAYHLFDCTTLKIICRSKWQKVHGDQIESFDLDSSGRRIATFDKGAVCSISDIDNNGKYIAHVKLDQSQGVDTRTNRCRWNPLADSSMIYLAHDVNKLNVYDFEKMELILKEPLKLEQPGKYTRWIDCRYDGNLLASAGWDGTTKIYDHRVGNIIKVIEGKDYVYCVRWSLDGEYLATANADGNAYHTSFSTGKHIGFSSQPNLTPSSVCYA